MTAVLPIPAPQNWLANPAATSVDGRSRPYNIPNSSPQSRPIRKQADRHKVQPLAKQQQEKLLKLSEKFNTP